MLPLLDVQFEWCFADVKLSLSKAWFLCAAVQISVRITYLFSFLPIYFLHEIGGVSWLTLWRCWLHSCRMFILIVELNSETSFLFWSGFCMAKSWARKTFTLLSLCTLSGSLCVYPNRPMMRVSVWQLGLCLCSLTEQTDQQFRLLMRYSRQ